MLRPAKNGRNHRRARSILTGVRPATCFLLTREEQEILCSGKGGIVQSPEIVVFGLLQWFKRFFTVVILLKQLIKVGVLFARHRVH